MGLARVFEIPWIMVCDNDDEGKKFVKQIKNRGLTDEEIDKLVKLLPEKGMVLESFLAKNGFIQEYIQIFAERNIGLTKKKGEAGFEDEIASKIRPDKMDGTIALIEKLRAAGADKSRVPSFFDTVIKDIIAKVV